MDFVQFSTLFKRMNFPRAAQIHTTTEACIIYEKVQILTKMHRLYTCTDRDAMILWVLGVNHGPIRIHKSLRDPECDVRGVGHDSLFNAVTLHTPVIHRGVTSAVITLMVSLVP